MAAACLVQVIWQDGCFSVSADVKWDDSRRGKDIVLSNNNITVTRSNGNEWGGVLGSQCFTAGQHTFTFQIGAHLSFTPSLHLSVSPSLPHTLFLFISLPPPPCTTFLYSNSPCRCTLSPRGGIISFWHHLFLASSLFGIISFCT
jgi:hypothetical protein